MPEKEFSGIYSEYFQKVCNIAMRMTCNQATAQDLTQEIFIKIYQNLHNFGEKSKISTWIYKLTMNHCIDFLRREQTLTKKLQDIFLRRKVSASITENEIVNRYAGYSILKKMSPVNRAIMILRTYLDLSYDEIGEILKMTKQSVGVQLTRARFEAAKIAGKEGINSELQ